MSSLSPSKRSVRALSLALAGLFVLESCAVNPATGQGNLVMMSENRELEIGLEEHNKVMQTMAVVQDADLTADSLTFFSS